ncbi:hypothetical protein DPMN_020123 [Dreissena polymorpha]|uniref:Uncharacterized protein n=1 Tax=Dreissena polymorpha TaxID=45954 RepID=A0A9D4NM02_DREPO|nr:hypothetical protein DPMN_020123 [Dreissena polymorpha]
MKNDPPRGGHVFQRTGTIFKLVQDIFGTNLLANSHDDQTIKLASRVLTRLAYALLPGDHVFQPTFHEDQTLNTITVASRVNGHIIKNAPRPGGHVLKGPFHTLVNLQN